MIARRRLGFGVPLVLVAVLERCTGPPGSWASRSGLGKPLWVIINLQMEGSSGSPGPTGDTSYRARNVYIGRSRA